MSDEDRTDGDLTAAQARDALDKTFDIALILKGLDGLLELAEPIRRPLSPAAPASLSWGGSPPRPPDPIARTARRRSP